MWYAEKFNTVTYLWNERKRIHIKRPVGDDIHCNASRDIHCGNNQNDHCVHV